MDGLGVRIDAADDLNSCCHDGASLSVRTDEVRRRLGPGRQDIDETFAKLLLGHPRPSRRRPRGPDETNGRQPSRASVSGWVTARGSAFPVSMSVAFRSLTGMSALDIEPPSADGLVVRLDEVLADLAAAVDRTRVLYLPLHGGAPT